jgi:type IV secretion system protein VirB8
MLKRSQQDVSDGSKHWYQDKYQHVLTQRNLLAIIAMISLFAAAMAVLAVMFLAPLKSVEPYLLQIDETTGITQRVIPLTKKEYAASSAVDRYFTALYIRMREGYNFNMLRYNYNVVRLMSDPRVFFRFRNQADIKNEESPAFRLKTFGMRDVRVRSMIYIKAPADKSKAKKASGPSRSKMIQARITTTESSPNTNDIVEQWVVYITFEYADLSLNQEEQLLNPLGYVVTSYQIEREVE